MDAHALRQRIEALQLAYVHCIDDGALEGWPAFFTDPCLYSIIGRDNHRRGLPIGVMRCESVAMMRDRVTAMRNAAVFAPRTIRHVLGGTRPLAADGEGVRAQTNVAIYQTSAEGDTVLLTVAEYLDRIVDDGGGLRFAEKTVVYDTLRLPDSVVFPL